MTKYCLLPLLFLLAGCFPCGYRSALYELEPCALETSDSVCAGEYPSQAWWTFFADEQLNTFIACALEEHPTVKMAEARICKAREEAIVMRSSLLPHFNLFGDLRREKLSEFGSRVQATPDYVTEATLLLTSASYELDIWGKNRHAYYSAIDEMFAQIADYEQAKLVLSSTIASVYVDLQFNIEQLRITKERLVARQKVYELLRQRFDAGVISEFFLYETDTEVEMLRDLLLQQEAFIAIDEHAIKALVGADVCVAPAALFDSPLPLPACLPIDLLKRRPDISAQINRVEALNFQVAVAKANFFPRIDLLGDLGALSFRLAKLFTGKAFVWLADATCSLPLYTASELEGELGVARERVEIAIEEYNQLVLNAVQQVNDALTNLSSADKRKAVLRRSISDAQALLNLTEQKFDNGLVDRIAVLNGLENVLIQQGLEVAVELDRFQSAVALIRAIGGGYVDECR